jgi:hypothetical protein
MGSCAHLIGDDSNWEPDGVTLQVRFCEESGTNCRMAKIRWHRREIRRPTENTTFGLSGGKNPAYSPKISPCTMPVDIQDEFMTA